MKIHTLLAKNVRLYRRRLGYSQDRLAEECSMIAQEDALANWSYISDVENSRRNITLDKVGILARALHVEPFRLFLTEEPTERM